MDLEGWDQGKSSKPPQRRVRVEVSMREHVLDEWARAERYIRAAAALLAAEGNGHVDDQASASAQGLWRSDVAPYWKDMAAKRVKDVLTILERSLVSRSTPAPKQFRQHLLDLYAMRNLLAHNESRPIFMDLDSGVRVLKALQYGKATYITISNDQMVEVSKRGAAMSDWLADLLPEVDRIGVEVHEDEVARLIAELPEYFLE